YLAGVHGAAGVHQLLEKGHEYLAFILLLGSLFVVTGGIVIRGSLSGTPLLNTLLIGIGGALASFIGTTGASVLLIRPLLRANAPRRRKAHVVVFFIFIVSNCGGLLTPLGDPPLFLGFLKGVPFEWTFRLWAPWMLVNGALLAIFFIYDTLVFNREEAERPGSQYEEVVHHEALGFQGAHNFLCLGLVVLVIYAAGSGWGTGGKAWGDVQFGMQELAMLAVMVVSYLATKRDIRERNRFTFTPIVEVAVLFAGIFVTMIPALQLLNAKGPELGLSEPWQFFWATGLL